MDHFDCVFWQLYNYRQLTRIQEDVQLSSLFTKFCKSNSNLSWLGVAVITTAPSCSVALACSGYHYCTTKLKLRFCTGSNPALKVWEIRDGEDLWQWSRLKIRLNTFRRSTIPLKQLIIIIGLLRNHTCLFLLT